MPKTEPLPKGTWVTGRGKSLRIVCPDHPGNLWVIKTSPQRQDAAAGGYVQGIQCLICTKIYPSRDVELLQEVCTDAYLMEQHDILVEWAGRFKRVSRKIAREIVL